MESIINLTQNTSATRSFRMIYQKLLNKKLKMIAQDSRIAADQKLWEERALMLKPEGIWLYSRVPALTKELLNGFAKWKVIINARDPRDFLCNQFYWHYQHPVPVNSPLKVQEQEIKEKRRAAAESMGIDKWVLARDPAYLHDLFKQFNEVIETVPPTRRCMNSYALLCLEFDTLVESFCQFVGIEPGPELLQLIECERTENLVNNPEWAGNKWEGADCGPGRFRQELQPETIKILNERYYEELEFLRRYDHPLVQHTYV